MLQFLSNYINFKKSFTNESKVKIQAKKRKRKKKAAFQIKEQVWAIFFGLFGQNFEIQNY